MSQVFFPGMDMLRKIQIGFDFKNPVRAFYLVLRFNVIKLVSCACIYDLIKFMFRCKVAENGLGFTTVKLGRQFVQEGLHSHESHLNHIKLKINIFLCTQKVYYAHII